MSTNFFFESKEVSLYRPSQWTSWKILIKIRGKTNKRAAKILLKPRIQIFRNARWVAKKLIYWIVTKIHGAWLEVEWIMKHACAMFAYRRWRESVNMENNCSVSMTQFIPATERHSFSISSLSIARVDVCGLGNRQISIELEWNEACINNIFSPLDIAVKCRKKAKRWKNCEPCDKKRIATCAISITVWTHTLATFFLEFISSLLQIIDSQLVNLITIKFITSFFI